MKLLCPICQDVLYEPNAKILPVRGGRFHHSKVKVIHNSCRNTGKPPLPPSLNPVISSRCGHIFHKKCIMNYMRAYRAELKQSGVECPCCKCQVILAVQMPIDFTASDQYDKLEGKEFNRVRALNTELKGQSKELTQQLLILERKIKQTLDKFHLADSGVELQNETRKAQEKTQRAQEKLKRAEEKAKKAQDYLQIVNERSRRFQTNWKMGEQDAMESEQLCRMSEQVVDQKPPLPPTLHPQSSILPKKIKSSHKMGLFAEQKKLRSNSKISKYSYLPSLSQRK